MLLTYEAEKDFRRYCREYPCVDFWGLYEKLETNDDNYNIPLYERIQTGLLAWLEERTVSKVFYSGDLEFEFESATERDLFDKECGDPVLFKLTWA